MNVLKKTILRAINFLLGPLNLKINSSYSGGRLFPESFRYLKQVLPQPGEMTVIDIGVADGTAELWSAFPSSQYRYLLIEANPVYAKQLEVFGKKMNAITEKVFCGDHDGMESFITDDSYDPGKASKYGRKTGNGEKRSGIPCFKLDTILKRHNLPQPYILKIDVEGAEGLVIKGISEQNRPEHLFVELHPDFLIRSYQTTPVEVWNNILALGFEPVHVWQRSSDVLGHFKLK